MRTIIDGAEYLDIKEAASVAGYSEEHIRRLARQGSIESVKHGGRVFVLASSLVSYVYKMKALGSQKYSAFREE